MNALTKIENTVLQAMSEVLHYDAASGQFTWKVKRRGGANAGQVAGTVTVDGYVQIHVCGKLHKAHRLAWLFTHGVWPTYHIDHIDGNPGNNAIRNLRDVSAAINQQNQRRAHRSNQSSGLLGVSFDARTGRWLSKISVNNKTKNLGRYATPEKAHAAYVSAKKTLHQGSTL